MGVKAKKRENLKDYILEKEKEGMVVISTFDGFKQQKLSEMIKQSAEGILYDLNRDKATVLTFIDDRKWVNDYAVGLVISELKHLLNESVK